MEIPYVNTYDTNPTGGGVHYNITAQISLFVVRTSSDAHAMIIIVHSNLLGLELSKSLSYNFTNDTLNFISDF
jgi:hypothetical protein